MIKYRCTKCNTERIIEKKVAMKTCWICQVEMEVVDE